MWRRVSFFVHFFSVKVKNLEVPLICLKEKAYSIFWFRWKVNSNNGSNLFSDATGNPTLVDFDFNIIVLCSEFRGISSIKSKLCHELNNFWDNIPLACIYTAVDIVGVTSLVDSFCQVSSEAQSCGTPDAAFTALKLWILLLMISLVIFRLFFLWIYWP